MPATGVIRDLPTEVEVGRAEGMPIECVLVVDNTFSAESASLTARITTLSPERLAEVCAALNLATSC